MIPRGFPTLDRCAIVRFGFVVTMIDGRLLVDPGRLLVFVIMIPRLAVVLQMLGMVENGFAMERKLVWFAMFQERFAMFQEGLLMFKGRFAMFQEGLAMFQGRFAVFQEGLAMVQDWFVMMLDGFIVFEDRSSIEGDLASFAVILKRFVVFDDRFA